MISEKKIRNVQDILQYKFRKIEILKICLTHPSKFSNIKKVNDKYIYEFGRHIKSESKFSHSVK